MDELKLQLTPSELTSVIEGLHDAILRRLRWSAIEHPSYGTWRSLDIETVQTVIDTLVSSYTKAMMLYREGDFPKVSAFESKFLLHEDVWEMLSVVTIADSWDDIPYHDIHLIEDNCPICGAIAALP